VKNLATIAISHPSCTTDNNGGVICSLYTKAGATLANRYANGAWEGFLNLTGIAGGEPDCTSMNQNGNVVCFAKGYASGVYGNRFFGGAWAATRWGGYGAMSGTVNDNAGCTSHTAGLLVCGATAVTDNAFYANVWGGSSWSGWSKIGGSGTGSPACAPLGTGKVVCVMKALNNLITSVVGP
jgi:hypothetical protein